MNQIDSRIAAVQGYLRSHGLSALYISGTDVHLGEYVPERYRSREWMTGFTGSAGTVIVTLDGCHLWVDSRYYIQGELQTRENGVTLHLLGMDGVQPPFEWLGGRKLASLAVDGTTISVEDFRSLEKKLSGTTAEITVVDDVLDTLWESRPERPFSPLRDLPVKTAGRSRKEKIELLRNLMKKEGTDGVLLSTLDDIAWVTNLRGRDLPFTPVFYAYLVITQKKAVLFTDLSRFDDALLPSVSQDITIAPYESLSDTLPSLLEECSSVQLATTQTTVALFEAVKDITRVDEVQIQRSTFEKAKKDAAEIEGFRRAHYLDGLALVRFLASLSKEKETLTEISIAKRLESFREMSEEYLFPSFSPIAGYRGHGAMEHYSATQESCAALEGDGLLVLDTGGQYLSGTTDVTRTLLFGEPSEEMKRDYTLVLKGNLALSKARFPQGTCGYQLDVLARQFLWDRGYTYRHGTGHGVGFSLGVHEGPMRISPNALEIPLEAGHVLSNEPGIYRRDEWGIRLENLVSVFSEGVTEFGQFNTFEVLTLCPFERCLIDSALLSDEELSLLNAYHQWVYEELSRSLSEEDGHWLREATLPIER